MTWITHTGLPRDRRPMIIHRRVKYATFMALSLLAHAALAQQSSATAVPTSDDLDVTMQIIVDPDAKLPDEVVRRIPLPERKSTPFPAAKTESKDANQPNSPNKPDKPDKPGKPDKPDKPAKPDKPDRSNARDARDMGREAGQSARDRAREAKEQREQARRAAAEERRRRNEDNPNRPPNPPGRPPRN